MIRLTIPHIGNKEIKAVSNVLRSGFLTQGNGVQKFENTIKDYVGSKHAMAVSSGTAALHLALLALGIGKGDEIIIPDFTFPATCNVIELVGAKPILVDIKLDTFNIDESLIEKAITSKTKAIMPVHLFGQSAEMETILKIARTNNLFVIEDAACALGASYRGKPCGTLGDIGCFSFHPRKVMTTGEGGMVVTDNDEIVKKIRLLRNHGLETSKRYPVFQMAGFNCRLTEFQAALGLVQCNKLETMILHRIALAKEYDYLFQELDDVIIPAIDSNRRHIYQSYVILLKNQKLRNKVIQELKKRNIETNFGTYALSLQKYYKKYCTKGHVLRCSKKAFFRSIALPIYSGMKNSQVLKVARSLKRILNNEKSW